MTRVWLFQGLETPSVFHPHAQRIAYRRRDARQQSRSFGPWNLIAETQPQLHSALLRLSADNFPGTPRAAVCVYSLFSTTCGAGRLIWFHALTSVGPALSASICCCRRAIALAGQYGFSAQSFWRRGSFRSGSNIGSSRNSAAVSGTPTARKDLAL
jgi:hypothetical protein